MRQVLSDLLSQQGNYDADNYFDNIYGNNVMEKLDKDWG
jgi:hypothetical protein